MPITAAQKAQADQRQWVAAQDQAPQVRLVAGPGTGKSYTIEKRVVDLLNNGATPTNVYVISFTRATCGELVDRRKEGSSVRSTLLTGVIHKKVGLLIKNRKGQGA